jgi:hypothetical protein
VQYHSDLVSSLLLAFRIRYCFVNSYVELFRRLQLCVPPILDRVGPSCRHCGGERYRGEQNAFILSVEAQFSGLNNIGSAKTDAEMRETSPGTGNLAFQQMASEMRINFEIKDRTVATDSLSQHRD